MNRAVSTTRFDVVNLKKKNTLNNNIFKRVLNMYFRVIDKTD